MAERAGARSALEIPGLLHAACVSHPEETTKMILEAAAQTASTRPPHVAGRWNFPSGWGFRAQMLDQDMEVSSAHHGNPAHVVQHNLHNAYQGLDVARAFSELCQKDSLR